MNIEAPHLGMYDFMYGRYLLKSYFDIEMQDGDYIEHAYNIYKEIGNAYKARYMHKALVGADCKVILPCNASIILYVSTGDQWDSKTNAIDWLDIQGIGNPYVRGFISRSGMNVMYNHQQRTITRAEGEYIPYSLEALGDRYSIKVDPIYIGQVLHVGYKGLCTDMDGNPSLYRKEAEAIAYRLAYMDVQRDVFKHIPAAMQILPMIKMKSDVAMAATKVPEHITQNEMNRVLSVMTSHDRKVYFSSYKI